ncbi:plant UBX domain-containing protein 8-like isoform X1 [Rhododendron vialii]|uniref:plant UBX domain-containing protein 8-like isoform X1 n=1 Tax=Rhododendron vialii TaxID=182163 RepID=UPI00265E34E9|nr:plant UBX domain-containing protein 8-like isoform X1 [Rhododendron vialii]
MARPCQEAIDTFTSITGVPEAVAVQKLEEHGGDLNEAVNAHFTGGDISTMNEISALAPQNDAMDIDEDVQVGFREPPFTILPSARNLSPFSLLDPDFHRGLFDSGTNITSREPFVSHPREVREIPIEVKDGDEQSGGSDLAPTIEDVTGTAFARGPENQGTVIIDNDDDISTAPSGQNDQNDGFLGYNPRGTYPRPSAPGIDDLPYYNNDIEEEMVRAAIEASKRDRSFGAHDDLSNPVIQQRQSRLEDPELAQAVSLSLKTAEQEKTSLELGGKVGAAELEAYKSTEVGDIGKLTSSNERLSRLDVGSSSIQDEAEDVEEQPLVRHRSRRVSYASINFGKENEEAEVTPPSSPGQDDDINHPPTNIIDPPTDEWGGMSSEEHDEAIMLEAALFGGIPEGSGYRFPFAPHRLTQDGLDRTSGFYPQRIPRSPSPGLTAQRLIREQQDDEYLASLQADREKELKTMEEAEARRLEEQAAREAALEVEKRKEEELRRKLEEEQEIERQLAAKEASLPQEPTSDNENAVTLLVRMPDGSRHGRRFLKSDKLQSLFYFIDVGRGVKPGSYRLVRPYPRRAFDDGESASTLNELGLTSKQEALFLELI